MRNNIFPIILAFGLSVFLLTGFPFTANGNVEETSPTVIDGALDDSDMASWIESLLTDLSDYKDQDKQMKAYYLLTQMGESALPSLMENLKKDGYSDIRHGNHSYTMRLIEKIGAPAVGHLIASVTDDMIREDPGLVDTSKPSYVTSVVKILGVIHDDRLAPFAIKVLENSRSFMLTESVVWELMGSQEEDLKNGFGDKLLVPKLDFGTYRSQLMPVLFKIIESNQVGFSYEGYGSLRLIGKLGTSEDLPTLEQLRKRLPGEVKISLAMALYDLSSDKYLDVLNEVFFIKNIETVRQAAAELLYFKTGYKDLVPKIIALMGRESGIMLGTQYGQFIYGGNDLRHILARLPHICGEVLHVMTYQDFGPAQGKWQKWWQENKNLSREEWKQNRIKELRSLLGKAGIKQKLKLLEGLVGIEGEEVVDLVRPYLTVYEPHNMNPNVSKLAMEVVKHSQSARAKEIFVGLLKDPDIWVARDAIDSLKEYQDASLIPLFLEYLKRYCRFVQEMSLGDCSSAESQVASILIKKGNPAGLGMLIDLVERNDDSQDAYIRELRAYTQQYFGYKKDLAPEQKKEVLKKWRQWYEEKGKQAPVKIKEAFIDRDWRE